MVQVDNEILFSNKRNEVLSRAANKPFPERQIPRVRSYTSGRLETKTRLAREHKKLERGERLREFESVTKPQLERMHSRIS